jgi:hypothetical protein
MLVMRVETRNFAIFIYFFIFILILVKILLFDDVKIIGIFSIDLLLFVLSFGYCLIEVVGSTGRFKNLAKLLCLFN